MTTLDHSHRKQTVQDFFKTEIGQQYDHIRFPFSRREGMINEELRRDYQNYKTSLKASAIANGYVPTVAKREFSKKRGTEFYKCEFGKKWKTYKGSCAKNKEWKYEYFSFIVKGLRTQAEMDEQRKLKDERARILGVKKGDSVSNVKWKKEKVECECGKTLCRGYIPRHIKDSQVHAKWVKKNKPPPPIPKPRPAFSLVKEEEDEEEDEEDPCDICIVCIEKYDYKKYW